MKSQQSGFTLVEIAIVLVIIGLLLGGILKGQELINSAKVKNLANDFRVVPTYIYAYQDKFKALPGDDSQVTVHLGASATAANTGGTVGNGVIEGSPMSTTQTDESYLFWQHVRLANLAAGPTTVGAGYTPTNAVGGNIGVASLVTSGGNANAVITAPTPVMSGTYQVCSDGILGRFVKQLDIQMDDGDTQKGSMRAALSSAPGTAIATASIDDGSAYIVCMAF